MALSSVTRLPVRRNPNYVANGTKSLVWLFHKYNINPTRPGRFHRNKEHVLMKRQEDGSATAISADDQQNDVFYTCPVHIGTPAQTLDVTFDSGSSDFWVWSSYLPEETVRTGVSHGAVIFDPSKSSSAQMVPGAKWRIRYGDGSSASGNVVTDNVKLGDIMVQGQAIEVATQISEQLVSQSSSHGILGLGFGNINTVTPTQVKTPLENMILQKDIPASQELFTCYLGSYKDVNNTDKGESFFTFGGIAEDVVQSAGQEITYTPVDSSHGFWKISSESMVVNGQTFPQPGGTAIVDTGTTLVLISDEMVNAIYAVIPGAVYSERDQGWVFPADIPSEQLPVVSFAVGETQIAIEQEQLGFTPANKTGMVFGGIQSRGSLEYNILGDTFFKCVYAIFDEGNKQFGVVQRVDPTQNISQA